MKKIAILGANGRLSSMAATAFHKAGYTVIGVTRNGKAHNSVAYTEVRAADALNPENLIQATKGVDFIFNGLNPLYTRWAADALPIAENVVAAASANSAVHLFPGNVYNYGTEIHLDMTEDCKVSPSVAKGLIRIQMEETFRRSAQTNNVQTLMLRAGDFYGGTVPGSWFDLALVSKLGKGIFTYPGPMDLAHSWAYLPDLAGAFVSLANKADNLAVFEQVNFQGHTLSGAEMMSLIDTVLGKPIRFQKFPWFLLKAGGLFNPMWREISAMSYLWKTPHSLCGRKLEKIEPGFKQTSAQAAVRNALSDLDLVS